MAAERRVYSDAGGRLWIGAGPRAVERAVLADLCELVEASRDDPALLAQPVRVIVPSRSLREHLAGQLVGELGRPAAGVTLQTLYGLALEMVDRAGDRAPGSHLLFPSLVEQLARTQPELSRPLDALEEGYGVVEAAVSDLLDAGLEPALVEGVEECLAACEEQGAPVAVARAVLRVARDSFEVGPAQGLVHRSRLLVAAREALEAEGDRVLPARAILVHGFAEATGVGAELLEAVVRRPGARVYLDSPPASGADARATDREPDSFVIAPFARRLHDRMGGVLDVERLQEETERPPAEALLEAPGVTAEVRAVAIRVRELLKGGACPEKVAIVARDLGPYATTLRTQLNRLAIPFSGVAATAVSVGARRAAALLALLVEGPRCHADRWLEARWSGDEADAPKRGERRDLRLALRHLGAARVEDVAKLVVSRESIALPIRHVVGGVESDTDGEDGDVPDVEASPAVSSRRVLAASILRGVVTDARRLCDRLAARPTEAALADHVAWLRGLLTEELGWGGGSAPGGTLEEALSLLDEAGGCNLALAAGDFVSICRRVLRAQGEEPLGGRGGGVQVLTVMEARARTFEQLFVLGMNRDVFPRVVREDPLISDSLRRALRAVLPELPVKSEAYDEERYLFDQLLAAAGSVTLSWQSTAEDGKERAPSALVNQLAGGMEDSPKPIAVPSLHGRWEYEALSPRPAHEHALRAGLLAGRPGLRQVLRPALEERLRSLQARRGGASSVVHPEALEAGRLAVLDEVDRAPWSAALGPYFGFVGPSCGDDDSQASEIWATQLEGLARCPWQYFVEKRLGIEVVPDPVEALPGVDALLLGSTVHATLERLAEGALSGTGVQHLDEVDPAGGLPMLWPGRQVVDAALSEAARANLEESGLALPGLEHALAERARPYVERAHDLEWAGASVPRVAGVEVEGALAVSLDDGGVVVLRFRADRVDALDGELVLVDYKTGKGISTAKTPAKRREHFAKEIASGKKLQAVAYALAAGKSTARGRYVFLKPGLEPSMALDEVGADDEELSRLFERTVSTLLEARSLGAFVPRLANATGESEPSACKYCTVAEACVRRDSGARRRLVEWMAGARVSPPATSAEAAALALWDLGSATDPSAPEEGG